MVAPAVHSVRQRRGLREISELLWGRADADDHDSWRRGDRVRADGPRCRVGLAHGAAPRYRRERTLTQARGRASEGPVHQGRAGVAAGPRDASQPAAWRDVEAYGTRA